MADDRSGGIRIPGATAIDHAGFVVPDLDRAVEFFTTILGGAVLWRAAPIADKSVDMRAMFGAARGSSSKLAMLRLGPNLNVELVEYTVPDDTRERPMASDIGVGHLAFAVDDIKAAGAYLEGEGVRMLDGPRRNESGPNEGQSSWFFMTPWGMVMELVQRPEHMPYEAQADARLFSAK